MSEDRAKELFLSNLTDTQRKMYDRCECIVVIGGDTGTIYLIRCNGLITFNIRCVEYFLCLTPKEELPVFDIYLSQKIALECFENEALRIGNKIKYRP